MTSANGGGGDRTEDWRSSSVWAEALHRQFGPVTSDRTVDVVVVGAGIAGLVTATVLSRSGADVLVVDRHEVGGVATRNTTAKVSALQGTRYQEILHSRGADVAAAYAAAQVDAVTGIRRLSQTSMSIVHARRRRPSPTQPTPMESAAPAPNSKPPAMPVFPSAG